MSTRRQAARRNAGWVGSASRLLLIAALVGPLAACSRPSSSTQAPPLAQVNALLARHGAAVLDHSASRFLADVDTAAPAARFFAAQRAEIANIAGVPLQSWSYTADSVVSDPSVLAAQRARLGAPVLIVHVTLSYALRDIDPEPTAHDLWWTFVARHGRVYLAGADAMAGQGGTSFVGPWDFGPVVLARGAASLVLGHPAQAGLLPGLARAVDAAVPVVTGVWGSDWAQRVAVFVPDSSTEFSDLVGTGTSLTDVSAETVFDTQDPVNGGRYGQRIVLNPTALATLSPVGIGIVLRHEITHVASAASTTPATPRWLVEGLAEYVANLTTGQSARTAAPELAAAVRRGVLPRSLPGDSAFAAGGPALAQLYEQSWLACRLIARRVGAAGLVRFYRQVGVSAQGPDGAVATALGRVLHESPAAFLAQWRAYLTAVLG